MRATIYKLHLRGGAATRAACASPRAVSPAYRPASRPTFAARAFPREIPHDDFAPLDFRQDEVLQVLEPSRRECRSD